MKASSIGRRTFLATSSLAAGGLLIHGRAFAQASAGSLQIQTKAPGTAISPDFIGLSYENMQLEDPTFFSPKNTGLIEQFRAISSHGVLRLGGNTSEFNWWKADPNQAPPERKLVLKNGDKPQNTLYAISPDTIVALNGFLQATGWSCIYGLNLGFGTPETDIAEAKFVYDALGPRLQYFQIGNEVDMFVLYHLRDGDSWNCSAYLREWLNIARAVQRAIPGAKFGLPDVARDVPWLTEIAAQWGSVTDKPHVTTLSHHHYWSGPPSNPAATIEKLMQPDPVVVEHAERTRAAAQKMGTAYRMTEGNTVFRGGKSGLSDVFAAALWSADYLLTLMRFGYSGVNLHGGSGHAQAVSVGGTFVGEADMKDPNEPHPKPFYTPIANEGTLAGSGVDGKLNGKYLLEPSGYGIKFVSGFAGGTMLPVDFNPGAVNAVAFACRRADGKVLLAVLNKDNAQPVTFSLHGARLHEVLTAPSLSAKEAHILTGLPAAKLVKVAAGTVTVPAFTRRFLHPRLKSLASVGSLKYGYCHRERDEGPASQYGQRNRTRLYPQPAAERLTARGRNLCLAASSLSHRSRYLHSFLWGTAVCPPCPQPILPPEFRSPHPPPTSTSPPRPAMRPPSSPGAASGGRNPSSSASRVLPPPRQDMPAARPSTQPTRT